MAEEDPPAREGRDMSGKVVSWAMDQKTGSPVAKLVLVKLADNANESGYCWPSVDLIVEHTELSLRTVRTHLAKLEHDGFITIIRNRSANGQERSDYQLNVPADKNAGSPRSAAAARCRKGRVRDATDLSATDDTTRVQELHSHIEPSIEPSKNLPLLDAAAPSGRGDQRDEPVALEELVSSRAVSRFANDIGQAKFASWFGGVQFLDRKPVVVVVPSTHRKDVFEERGPCNIFNDALRRHFGDDVVVEVRP